MSKNYYRRLDYQKTKLSENYHALLGFDIRLAGCHSKDIVENAATPYPLFSKINE